MYLAKMLVLVSHDFIFVLISDGEDSASRTRSETRKEIKESPIVGSSSSSTRV
uniref:Uncharacterized protein n=1 Tax=Nelumbo nucifera TaxID=4432 RepID=A0A822Z769_NELNU|nr:TPA_asm: hypothetical protein HUJ06_013572 [Nelumbo nucifera]